MIPLISQPNAHISDTSPASRLDRGKVSEGYDGHEGNLLESKHSTNLLSFKQPFDLLYIPQITFHNLQPLITRKLGRFDNIGRDNPQRGKEIKEELGKLCTDETCTSV